MKECNCARCRGDGPPDDYDEPEPETEFIFRFIRPRIIKGALFVDERKVEVDEDHRVVEYARHVTRSRIYRWNRREVDCVRRWAAKHPRVGPKYLVALEAIK